MSTPTPPALKTVYTFPVELTNSDGSKSTVTVAFKRPSRAEREDADTWRAGWWSKYVTDKGLLPEALLLRQYDNGGGIYSDSQKAEIESIKKRVGEVEFEQAGAKSVGDKPLIVSLEVEMTTLRERFVRLQRIKDTFFSNTAEAKALQRLTEWLVLFMSYYRPDASSPWTPLFPGASEEEKYASLDSMDESPLYQKSISNLHAVAELFIATNGTVKQEDIEAFSVAEKAPSDVAASAVTDSLPTPASDASSPVTSP